MISLFRIDDRLVHGQIMAVWARVLNINHIIVTDDGTASDAFSMQLLKLAMPPSIQLTVTGITDAVQLLQNAASDKSHTLVLMKSVESAFRLHTLFPLNHLNVGGIGMAPGRQLMWRSIAATEAEVSLLRSMARGGVNVYLQLIPSEEKRVLSDG